MAVATPKKCQGKFSGMMVELSKVIANWERSGQGNGSVELEGGKLNKADNTVQYGSLQHQLWGFRSMGMLCRLLLFIPM